MSFGNQALLKHCAHIQLDKRERWRRLLFGFFQDILQLKSPNTSELRTALSFFLSRRLNNMVRIHTQNASVCHAGRTHVFNAKFAPYRNTRGL